MAMENKRIIQLSTERTNLTSGDYVMVDSDADGSAKYRLDRLKETDTTLSVSGKAADAAATGQAISAETQARTQAVTAETQARQQAIMAESQARQAADTTLGNDVQDLKSATSLHDDEIDNTVQTITFASDGSVQKIEHKRNNVIIRTDTFTFATNMITEVRTLNTGETLTIATNLTTLETTVTYAAA
jgi:seryl-tRNA synthetase